MHKNSYIHWLKSIGVEYYCSENSLRNYEPMVSKKLDNPEESKTEPARAIFTPQITPDDLKPSKQLDARLLARSLADKANNLEELKQYVLNFEGCNLKLLANNTVFGDGNKEGIVMLIGEAPGAQEDAKGIPFCGDSGKLLDNMLHSINISRLSNAYITNAVFWRPPGNRQPTAEEIEICKPFVEKHIALINPKLIILVGNTAVTSILGKNLGVTKIRQEYYLYSNKYLTKPIHTTAIFHPAYLLRQPTQKKTLWYDLLKIQEFLRQLNAML
jgi:uracil-DNA glycosylase family 4